jgi:hypothetical protein
MLGNPVDGVKRPASNNNEGSTPRSAMRRSAGCLRPRREELCLVRLRDLQSRQRVMHFRIK